MDRIILLTDRLERVKLARDMEPNPDALSKSLWALGEELAALNKDGLAAEAETLGIASDDVREMARTYTR